MSLTPQTITIDLNPSFSQMQTVHCSQYDDNIRQIEVKLKDGGTDIDVSSYTIYIEGTKPDKKGFSYPLNDIGSVDGNTVTFYVQLQMAAVPGMTRMEILLKDGDDHRIGSANFMLAVERAGLQDDTDVSDSELAPYISGAAQQAQAAANSAAAAETAAGNAEDSAEDAEAWAVGKRNGADVGSSDETYQNNAKYYSEQASETVSEVQGRVTTLEGEMDTAQEDLSDLKSALNNHTPIIDRSTWSKKRVGADGALVNSPSQLTTDKILYVGTGNVLILEAESVTRNYSISYYNDFSDSSYVQSDASLIRRIKFVKLKYDFIRISFVGSSANPPEISEFSVSLMQCSKDDFYNKKLAFLGDSITSFVGISEGTNEGLVAPYYPTSDVLYFEQTYEKMFFDACGASSIAVSAVSGSSWRNQGQTDRPSAYDDSRITRLGTNGAPDYVFINMGTNDPYSANIGTAIQNTYDTNSFDVTYSVDAIQLTIRKIQIAYPQTKIILLIPKFPSEIGNGNYTFDSWQKLCDFMIGASALYGVYKVIDLRKCGINIETFGSDCISSGMHPNFSGMKKIGTYLINELLINKHII